MKADTLRAQVTVPADIKALAVILAILAPLGYGTVEKTLKTVAAHHGLRIERAS